MVWMQIQANWTKVNDWAYYLVTLSLNVCVCKALFYLKNTTVPVDNL